MLISTALCSFVSAFLKAKGTDKPKKTHSMSQEFSENAEDINRNAGQYAQEEAIADALLDAMDEDSSTGNVPPSSNFEIGEWVWCYFEPSWFVATVLDAKEYSDDAMELSPTQRFVQFLTEQSACVVEASLLAPFSLDTTAHEEKIYCPNGLVELESVLNFYKGLEGSEADAAVVETILKKASKKVKKAAEKAEKAAKKDKKKDTQKKF